MRLELTEREAEVTAVLLETLVREKCAGCAPFAYDSARELAESIRKQMEGQKPAPKVPVKRPLVERKFNVSGKYTLRRRVTVDDAEVAQVMKDCEYSWDDEDEVSMATWMAAKQKLLDGMHSDIDAEYEEDENVEEVDDEGNIISNE